MRADLMQGSKKEDQFCILQVNTFDIGGGAEKIAWDLLKSYKLRGLGSYLCVGKKKTNNVDVFEMPNEQKRNYWVQFWTSASKSTSPLLEKIPFIGVCFIKLLKWIGQPQRNYRRLQGKEDFDYPGTKEVLKLTPSTPDILHCHNLHGGYFDLRELSNLSHKVPVLITLHDAWLLSGHCAHSFDCERWKIGCGDCPDLTIYPKIKKDGTSHNWKVKKEIYAQSNFYVVTPCKWLMDKVNESILKSGIVDSQIIPNGVDTGVFQLYDKNKARLELGLPQDKKILLFTANGIRQNIWKDYQTLKLAISKISIPGTSLLCIALGEDATNEKIGEIEIKFVPYQKDPDCVAQYYQAADIYVHPSRVDTFPNTVLEALACGVPVVATRTGGIPEQVDDGVTGFLVPSGNADVMASRIEELLLDDGLYKKMSENAREDVMRRFDLNKQVGEYLKLYASMIENGTNQK